MGCLIRIVPLLRCILKILFKARCLFKWFTIHIIDHRLLHLKVLVQNGLNSFLRPEEISSKVIQ